MRTSGRGVCTAAKVLKVQRKRKGMRDSFAVENQLKKVKVPVERAAAGGSSSKPRRNPGLGRLRVTPRPNRKAEGWLHAGALALPCCLGPAGLVRRKREGDGGTPIGTFALLGGQFRADRGPRPPVRPPMRVTRPDQGWCDDPGDPRYNRPVRLPARASHETLWRADRLYDLLVVIDYNTRRPLKGRGSAIFLHMMAPEATPTAGCVALKPGDLRRLLPRLGRHCVIRIG